MALSADADYVIEWTRPPAPTQMKVLNSSVVYNGALCSADTTDGLCKPFDGTQADRVVGFHFGDTITGDTSGNPDPVALIHSGPFIIRDLTVGGLANADTDNMQEVWASDDGTFTITDPSTTGTKIGYVIRDAQDPASGTAHVQVWDRLFGNIDS